MTYSTPQPYDPNLQPYAPVTIPKAPPGTQTNTLWIWLVVLLPVVQLIPLLFIPWASILDVSSLTGDPTSGYPTTGYPTSSLAFMTSPAYLAATLGGWVIYALCALCAYLDWKQLRDAGVPQPFHFAWVFLSSLVYVIGRSVVVKRRTGAGTAPMWVAIGVLVLSFIVSIYISVVIFSTVFSTITQYSYNYGS